ncbi:MAG TPA: Hsp20/alpha crystallin family protein [Gemmatimonadales bacterium]|nr:Hsp20/alpha crystallin family protein [Gemmatimonadales bacterium]
MYHLTQRDPIAHLLHHLEHPAGRLYREPLRTLEWPAPEAATASWLPPVDVFEEAESVRVVAEIPGVHPEDVKISVERSVLTIRGTKEQVVDEKVDRVFRSERTYGDFERSFTLSATMDSSRIRANYNLGVLTITLPKAETAKPHLIKVDLTPETAPLKA